MVDLQEYLSWKLISNLKVEEKGHWWVDFLTPVEDFWVCLWIGLGKKVRPMKSENGSKVLQKKGKCILAIMRFVRKRSW